MTNEIAPCPMPGCGGECRLVDCTERTYWITCKACNYTSNVFHAKGDAITAHNALCADVKLARNLRKLKGTSFIVKYTDDSVVVCNDSSSTGFYMDLNRTSGDTLDAALDQLAKKIGGDDES